MQEELAAQASACLHPTLLITHAQARSLVIADSEANIG
jgi:hypothetical protein